MIANSTEDVHEDALYPIHQALHICSTRVVERLTLGQADALDPGISRMRRRGSKKLESKEDIGDGQHRRRQRKAGRQEDG